MPTPFGPSGTAEWLTFDLDDVILDFIKGLTQVIWQDYAVDLTGKITDWNLRPVLDPILGKSWWKYLREREWLWSTFPAVEGAIGTLDRLRREGYKLEIVTSKPDWAEHNTWKWLGKWRPPVHRVTIINQEERKSDFASPLSRYLVDDKHANLVDWVDSKEGRIGLLYHRPHNRVSPGYHERIYRVRSWASVKEHITGCPERVEMV